MEPLTLDMLRTLAMAHGLNVSGHPAASVPCGFTAEGLPIGLQIVGRLFDEATVLRVTGAYQRATAWHTHRPPLAA